jgi:putative ABC transport system substrate-binding protein
VICRRECITLLGGAAAIWPLVARAQRGERMRRIGALLGGAETDQEFQTRIEAFREELQRLGWIEARNVRIEIRYGLGEVQAVRRQAEELVASVPDVILAASGSPGVIALQQVTQSIPIVFVNVTDPVGVGRSPACRAPRAT